MRVRESRPAGEGDCQQCGGEGWRKEAIFPGKELYNGRCLIFSSLQSSLGGGGAIARFKKKK